MYTELMFSCADAGNANAVVGKGQDYRCECLHIAVLHGC